MTYLDINTTGRLARQTAITTSTGAPDGGKIVALNSAGKIDDTMVNLAAVVQYAIGWHVPGVLIVATALGPVWALPVDSTLVTFVANVKTPPASTCTLDIESSADFVTWASIFSTRPTIAASASTSSGGVFSVSTLPADTFVRLNVVADGGAAGFTGLVWFHE